MNDETKEKQGLWSYLKSRTFTISLADFIVVFLTVGILDLAGGIAIAIIDAIWW